MAARGYENVPTRDIHMKQVGWRGYGCKGGTRTCPLEGGGVMAARGVRERAP